AASPHTSSSANAGQKSPSGSHQTRTIKLRDQTSSAGAGISQQFSPKLLAQKVNSNYLRGPAEGFKPPCSRDVSEYWETGLRLMVSPPFSAKLLQLSYAAELQPH
ncbi:MAG: hypothetical protein ABIW31_00925, partial [Novosphingobium sp.]